MCQPFHPLPVSFHLRVLFPVPTSHSTLISPHQHPSISCFEIATRNSQVTPKITIITSPVLVHPLLKTLQDTGKKRKRRPHASERSRPAASSQQPPFSSCSSIWPIWLVRFPWIRLDWTTNSGFWDFSAASIFTSNLHHHPFINNSIRRSLANCSRSLTLFFRFISHRFTLIARPGSFIVALYLVFPLQPNP
ncbi:putative secreted protein [Fusarium oxysporum f. sp. albedinis]|nr:putative secreted protein [Fusarium oxysporum f. sp. albedinis]